VIKKLFDRNHGRMIETICALMRELTVFTLTWQGNQASNGAFGTGPNGSSPARPFGAKDAGSSASANSGASSTTKRMGAHYETRIAQARYRNIVEPNSQRSTNGAADFESGSDVPSSEGGPITHIAHFPHFHFFTLILSRLYSIPLTSSHFHTFSLISTHFLSFPFISTISHTAHTTLTHTHTAYPHLLTHTHTHRISTLTHTHRIPADADGEECEVEDGNNTARDYETKGATSALDSDEQDDDDERQHEQDLLSSSPYFTKVMVVLCLFPVVLVVGEVVLVLFLY
jgi:hypothetical protein